ncbi:MAG: GGDEF domain-containing protein [Chloroflexi bacterium]|nr:GGDEF domain-containing protein [Chloroflexota bacterium]
MPAPRSRTSGLIHQALYDDSLGLPKLPIVLDRLDQAIRAADRDASGVTVLSVAIRADAEEPQGLDSSAAAAVATERLRKVIRQSDTLGRLGPDRFVVILPGTKLVSQASRAAGKIERALAQPVSTHGGPLRLDLNVGVAFYPRDGRDSQALLDSADQALTARQTRDSAAQPRRLRLPD